MTIEKRGDKYRITQMKDGIRYRVTVDHKPTKTEAMSLIVAEMGHPQAHVGMSFREAAEAYLDARENVLSPCTARNYRCMLGKLPEQLLDAGLSDITAIDVQKVVNDISKRVAWSATSSYAALIMGVLNAYDIDIKRPRLPQRTKKEYYIPEEEDVRRLLKATENTAYSIPLRLALLGMRRSEICALTLDDLDGDIVHINKSLVPGMGGKYVIKTTKTTESTRDIPIPHQLAEDIRAQGYIYRGNPNSITQAIYRIEDRLGMPRFSMHKLRHFFASYMHGKFTDKQIQAMGGWKTDMVLKQIYTHALDADNAKKDMADQMGKLF